MASSVQKIVLPNGVTIIVDSAPHFHCTAYAVCLRGGSRDDTREQIGLTHFVEHLVFKRTISKSPREIASVIDDLGADVNAFTDSDSFCLHGVVPQDRLFELTDFFAELLFQSRFTEADVALEKEVVRQEILAAEDDPADVVNQRFYERFFPNSLLGLPIFGTIKTLETFTKQNVIHRLDQMLVGSRIVIAVVGNVDLDQFTKRMSQSFGILQKGALPERVKPAHSCGISLVTRPVTQSYLTLGQSWPCITHEDYLPGAVFSSVFGEGMSSRLFQSVREEHGLAYEIESAVDAYADTGALLITASMERENIDRALELICNEIDRVKGEGVGADEISRAIKSISAQVLMSNDNIRTRLWRAIETEINLGRYIGVEEVVEKLNRVTCSDVVRMLETWVYPAQYQLVLGGDVEELNVSERVLGFVGAKQNPSSTE